MLEGLLRQNDRTTQTGTLLNRTQ